MATPRDCQGWAATSRFAPVGRQIENGNLSSRSYRQFYFNATLSWRPRIIAFNVLKWRAVGRCLTVIWHAALFGPLRDVSHRLEFQINWRQRIQAEAARRRSQAAWRHRHLYRLWPLTFDLPALGTVRRRRPGNWESSRTESPTTHPAARPIRCWYVSVVTQRKAGCFGSTTKVRKLWLLGQINIDFLDLLKVSGGPLLGNQTFTLIWVFYGVFF